MVKKFSRKDKYVEEFLYYAKASLKKNMTISSWLYVITERLKREKKEDMHSLSDRDLISYMREFYPKEYDTYLDILEKNISVNNFKKTFVITGRKNGITQ